jgi:ActR/RegA family two-component response regulator
LRILISEDDAVLAEALRFALTQSGFAVDWVANGVDADEALKASDFGLLILDLADQDTQAGSRISIKLLILLGYFFNKTAGPRARGAPHCRSWVQDFVRFFQYDD